MDESTRSKEKTNKHKKVSKTSIIKDTTQMK